MGVRTARLQVSAGRMAARGHTNWRSEAETVADNLLDGLLENLDELAAVAVRNPPAGKFRMLSHGCMATAVLSEPPSEHTQWQLRQR